MTGILSNHDLLRTQTLWMRFADSTWLAAKSAPGLIRDRNLAMVDVDACKCCHGPKFGIGSLLKITVRGGD